MKPITVHPGSALTGAGVLALVLLGTGIAAPHGTQRMFIENAADVGTPAAENIVNFDTLSLSTNPVGALDIPPSASIPIYTVPVTHRLVITDWKEQGNNIVLYQDLAGVLTGKLNETSMHHPQTVVQLVFEPGSQVVLTNINTQNNEGIFLTFSGYLEEL